MRNRLRSIWARARPGLGGAVVSIVRALCLCLDDLMLAAAGVCFITSAGLAFGCEAGLAVAGVVLTVGAVLIARARRGGSR